MSEPENKKPVNGKMRTGVILLISAAVVAFSPLAMAFLSTKPGHNMWSEGDSQSGGSYIWGMLITLPLGFIIGLVGLVLLIWASVTEKPSQTTGSPTGNNPKGAGITMIVLGSILILVNLPIIASIIGAAMAIAGGAVIWTGIRLINKGKGK